MRGDLSDRASLDAALAGVDGVFSMATPFEQVMVQSAGFTSRCTPSALSSEKPSSIASVRCDSVRSAAAASSTSMRRRASSSSALSLAAFGGDASAILLPSRGRPASTHSSGTWAGSVK